MTVLADSVEERDVWRALWRLLTGDVLLMVLCAVVATGLIAIVMLPQQPAAGTSDPVAYSLWEAEAKRREGVFYEPLINLGFNNVAQSVWWRAALAALLPVVGLRLADRLDRLFAVRRDRRGDEVRGERRVRVMLDAPPLDDLVERLRARRYRVVRPGDQLLVADRAPWAELLSAAFHLGLLLAAAALLLNLVAGWEAKNRTVVAGVLTPLPDGHAIMLADASGEADRVAAVLQPGDMPVVLEEGGWAYAAGMNIALRQILPGYRLSATAQDARPLLIRASNFVSPTTELLITFNADDPERYVAVPEARLALALTATAGQPTRLRVFAIPSGSVISDTVVRPELVVGDVVFRFKPAQGVVIDARHSPGDALGWAGLALALVGALGGLICPMQRLLIRRQGDWTEFYAGGRNSRREVARLIESSAESSTP